jgi:phytoene dehydrogenase-like protein
MLLRVCNVHNVPIATNLATADLIISAADGHSTIYGMLEGRYKNDLIQYYFDNPPPNEPFGIEVNMGVNMDLSSEPHAMSLLLDEPFEVEDGRQDSMFLELFTPETGLVPEGKGIIKADLVGSYDYWKGLSKSDYRKEKESIARRVINILEERFPGLDKNIEVVDVTTPVTCERFTGNFHGYQTWPSQKEARRIMREGLCRTLPGLEGMFLVGQWAQGAVGVSTAAISGRTTVEQICRMDGKRFETRTE